jgi:hypothetical protein
MTFGYIGRYIGRDKGRDDEGFWLGFFLGPIGLIIVALLQPMVDAEATRIAHVSALAQNDVPLDTRRCPWCAEQIKSAVIVCRFCGREVEAVQS